MQKIMVSIQEDMADSWLNAIACHSRVRDIEVCLSFLRNRDGLLRQIRRKGLQINMVREVIPPEVGRNLESLSRKEHDILLGELQTTIGACHVEGVRQMIIDLGMEKFAEIDDGKPLRERVQLVRRLLPAAESRNMQVLIPVRYPPPYPGSQAWEAATNLVHDVMHPACRIAVNFYPAYVDEDFNIAEFVKHYAFHLGALRFNFEPMLGESPSEKMMQSWAEILRWHGYRGDIIFVPRGIDEEGLPNVCGKLNRYIEIFSVLHGASKLSGPSE